MNKSDFKAAAISAVCGAALLVALPAAAADLPIKAPRWQIVAGYDAMYWTDVQRSGGLIDTTINPNLIPLPIPGGPARPQPVFNTSPLLAQGFNVGVRYNY
jgi:Putative beta barrel porin-7 (BBP7)